MNATSLPRIAGSVLLVVLISVGPPLSAHAQRMDDAGRRASTDGTPMVLTVDRAITVALKNNFNVRQAELDVRQADAQVREAWGSVLPQIDLTGNYTRNVVTANPFAGSDITTFLGGGGETEWLAFNERRRLDTDPASDPITFPTFRQRQRDSLQAAGISLTGGAGNPFSVDNEFRTGLQLTQTLYNGSAFSAIRGASQFKEVSTLARSREMQVVANDVYEAFYQALLAQQQARVLQQRVERSEETLQEITTQVAQGVTPKFQRLSAEVELSNVKTEMIQAQNQADVAVDNLKLTMGLPGDANIRIDGALEADPQGLYRQISTSRAIDAAIENRSDLRRADLNIELQNIRKETTESQYFPTVQAVANFSYTGRVPDNRTQIQTTDPDDPTNPFFFDQQERGFFEDEFWNPSFSVGLQLNWNIFSGFQTSARVQQEQIEVERAQVQRDQLRRSIEVEVKRALRNLETARERIRSQEQNVSRAELNYEHTSKRVSEGVSSPLELREASDQLDQSRLNFLQAVFDYLVARSDLETALGVPLTDDPEFQMTRR